MIDFKFDSVPPLIIQWTRDNVYIAQSVDTALHAFGFHATITGGMEGIHSGHSRIGTDPHYLGLALDFRIRDWPMSDRDAILRSIASKLDDAKVAYSYRLETDHLHVERTL